VPPAFSIPYLYSSVCIIFWEIVVVVMWMWLYSPSFLYPSGLDMFASFVCMMTAISAVSAQKPLWNPKRICSINPSSRRSSYSFFWLIIRYSLQNPFVCMLYPGPMAFVPQIFTNFTHAVPLPFCCAYTTPKPSQSFIMAHCGNAPLLHNELLLHDFSSRLALSPTYYSLVCFIFIAHKTLFK